ncbi:MAG: histidine phosphatase family protein [Clostridia bacterium]|nr:histidine phosphatase family protein [Clostridia bacterium]
MTEIYLVRHGYSKANELDIFLGQQNVDLTEKGRTQAKLACDYLKQFNISKIYSSDLDRACQTAEPLSSALNLPIIKRENLREIDGGEWDWVKYSEIDDKYHDIWKLWGCDICSSYCPGGETFIKLQDRIYKEMEKIAIANDGNIIAVYSHGSSIKSFICKVLGVTGKEANELRYPGNSSVSKLIYDNKKFNLEFYSKNDFLGNTATHLTITIKGE